jgi:hypothetical protein
MTLDLNKPVQLRDGTPARIICTDRKGGDRPIMALYVGPDGYEVMRTYRAGGAYYVDRLCDYDLVNVPLKKEGWVNIYQPWQYGPVANCWSVWPSKETAKANVGDAANYIATVKIEWEE